MSKQLLRSGTGAGALIREAQSAESTKDFIHKPGMAQKECDESLYWLELLNATDYLQQDQFDLMHAEATGILRMLKSAIITTKSKSSR
jgi:four helix bundle protein